MTIPQISKKNKKIQADIINENVFSRKQIFTNKRKL